MATDNLNGFLDARITAIERLVEVARTRLLAAEGQRESAKRDYDRLTKTLHHLRQARSEYGEEEASA